MRLVRLALLACLVTALASCVGPTRTADAMHIQVARSAGAAVSDLETIRLVTQAQLDGKSWWFFTDIVVTDSETTLGTVESTLASRQPPTAESARATQNALDAIGAAADLAREIRIAVRDHDDEQLRRLLAHVPPISDLLSHIEAVNA
jgi:hypothetical protein